jgi:hypothetical protein
MLKMQIYLRIMGKTYTKGIGVETQVNQEDMKIKMHPWCIKNSL